MYPHLIYTIGPSGAGKDSLLAWLRAQATGVTPVFFAQRSVTRKTDAGGEAHEAVSEAQFLQWRDAGLFALHWQANGLHYGVRHSALAPLAQGHCVFVNGSREYLPEAQRRFPGLTVLHITASPDVLQARLRARGREDSAAMAIRMERALQWRLPAGGQHMEIVNDGPLEAAGQRLLQQLALRFPGAPTV